MANPPSRIKTIRIIWDIDMVQKNRRSVITSVFWIRTIRNSNMKTSNTITFGFIIFSPILIFKKTGNPSLDRGPVLKTSCFFKEYQEL